MSAADYELVFECSKRDEPAEPERAGERIQGEEDIFVEEAAGGFVAVGAREGWVEEEVREEEQCPAGGEDEEGGFIWGGL